MAQSQSASTPQQISCCVLSAAAEVLDAAGLAAPELRFMDPTSTGQFAPVCDPPVPFLSVLRRSGRSRLIPAKECNSRWVWRGGLIVARCPAPKPPNPEDGCKGFLGWLGECTDPFNEGTVSGHAAALWADQWAIESHLVAALCRCLTGIGYPCRKAVMSASSFQFSRNAHSGTRFELEVLM